MRMPRQKDQALWLLVLVLILVLAGFFLPLSVRTWAGFGLKTGLFVAVFFLLYVFWLKPAMFSMPGKRSRSAEEPEEDMDPSDAPDGVVWKGFGDAFQWFYRNFVAIVRDATAASAVGLYLRKGDVLELTAAETDTGADYTKVLAHEGSLIDYVVQKKEPLKEDNLPIGSFLSGLDDLEIRSFSGVPLLVENKVTGVLAAGSEAEDHFSDEDTALLARSAQVLCQVMTVYHRAWRREIQEKMLQALVELEQALRPVEQEEDAFNVFLQALQKLFLFDRCVLCYRVKEEGEIRQVFGQIDQTDRGTRFSLDEGLTGLVMKRNIPMLVEDIQDGNFVRPRYYESEDTKHGMHAFLGVPLGKTGAWGCVTLESRREGQYQEREKNGLLTMIPVFELTLERLRLKEQLNQLT
ncbi:GAF domain-containing protein [bacterium]|nr:GAF domain-containing protein [bacterium]